MKVKKIIILGLLIVIITIVLLLLNIGYELTLNGDKKIELEINDIYDEAGIVVKHLGKDISSLVTINNNVDTTKVGEYQVIYTLKRMFVNKKITRTVIVKDSIAPVISLNGNNKVVLKVGEKYNELGVNAIDNYDGNITNNVIIEGVVDINKVGSYQIIYKIVDSSGNASSVIRTVEVEDKYTGGYKNIVEGPTYINGILIVNKKYSLPSTFGGTDSTALSALNKLQQSALSAGYNIPLVSGYRSYQTQKSIYNSYVSRWGVEYTDTVSARPGHSEHQTGLAFDVGELSSNYGETKPGIWLRENCYKYGFIIRYLKGKESITGYSYEPWHIRYVGVEVATEIMKRNITLEEYLGV